MSTSERTERKSKESKLLSADFLRDSGNRLHPQTDITEKQKKSFILVTTIKDTGQICLCKYIYQRCLFLCTVQRIFTEHHKLWKQAILSVITQTVVVSVCVCVCVCETLFHCRPRKKIPGSTIQRYGILHETSHICKVSYTVRCKTINAYRLLQS